MAQGTSWAVAVTQAYSYLLESLPQCRLLAPADRERWEGQTERVREKVRERERDREKAVVVEMLRESVSVCVSVFV